ncbi:hypothetical protein CsSME_00004997 [Camellia sinensis var. sinensis]
MKLLEEARLWRKVPSQTSLPQPLGRKKFRKT